MKLSMISFLFPHFQFETIIVVIYGPRTLLLILSFLIKLLFYSHCSTVGNSLILYPYFVRGVLFSTILYLRDKKISCPY